MTDIKVCPPVLSVASFKKTSSLVKPDYVSQMNVELKQSINKVLFVLGTWDCYGFLRNVTFILF